jgi:hypothetical protein
MEYNRLKNEEMESTSQLLIKTKWRRARGVENARILDIKR